MKVSDIKVNGINWTAPAKKISATLGAATELYRLRFSNEEIFNKFPANESHYMGLRYNDNKSVTFRIESAIVSKAMEELFNATYGTLLDEKQTLQLEEFIENWFYSLNAKEIDVLIQEGLRNCAETDHWYMYEKD